MPLELKNPPKKKPTANSLPASDRYQIDQINYHEQEMVIMPEIIQKKPENQPKKELIIPPIAQLQLQIEPIGIINFNDSDDEENHN